MQHTERLADGLVSYPIPARSIPPFVASVYENLDYEAWLAGSTESARITVPLIAEAVPARSVVDLGCGLGAWLAVFKEHGATEVLGYDGPWVDRSKLLIAPSEFAGHDLRERLVANRRFDLAVCLETAHVLEPEHAAPVVDALTSFAEVVAFSAGIPGQGGSTQLNEQWPSYWAELFSERGHVACDPWRLRLWEEADVKWWFRQNLLCYATPAALERLPALAASRCDGAPTPLVHPGCLEHVLGELEAARAPRERRRRWGRST